MATSTKRLIKEPGGIWLIGCGAPERTLVDAIKAQHQAFPDTSLTILIAPTQKAEAATADEIWVLDRYGLQGVLALIRRASWRRFHLVLQPWMTGDGAVPWLRFFIWPRPNWKCGDKSVKTRT